MHDDEFFDNDLDILDFREGKPTMFTALRVILEQGIIDGEVHLTDILEYLNKYKDKSEISKIKLIEIKSDNAKFYFETENGFSKRLVDVYYLNDKLICMGFKEINEEPIGFSNYEIKTILNIE